MALSLLLAACGIRQPVAQSGPTSGNSMELRYANQFSVEYRRDGCALITIVESGQFLLVPEGQEAPEVDVVLLRQPLENIYLAATSAMGLFDGLDALEHITLSGTQAHGWHIENARAAMERGDILYAGKYSAPDYELLLAKGCALAIESTMLYHAPEVQEKLQALGIPVLVERSSYESHPLGRTEWIKLYGLLTGRLAEAEVLFDAQTAFLEDLSAESVGKTVAFFYISSTGGVVARKSGDYAVKMIELAGGQYAFEELGNPDSAAGSVNLEMERFYAQAKDADIILYNSATTGEVRNLSELLALNPLLADFRAVQKGDVWCTGQNMFQETTNFGQMIAEMNRIFTGDAPEKLEYYYKLR